MPPGQNPSPPAKNRVNLSLSWRTLCALLLIIIIAMLIVWKPWQPSGKASDRTVSVTGDALVKAEPDQFVFSPSYEFKNADKPAALAALAKKNDEIVAQLKSLGVSDKQVKTNASGYSNGTYFPVVDGNTSTYTLNLTITLSDKALTQKVQDYLVTTTPTGQVSPQANFSESKRKSLETQARDQATKEARTKADQSAKNLGFKVSRVKSVDDGGGFGGGCGSTRLCPASSDIKTLQAAPSLSVQPGENELSYSVTVVYYIK